jgi:hypothetical protein
MQLPLPWNCDQQNKLRKLDYNNYTGRFVECLDLLMRIYGAVCQLAMVIATTNEQYFTETQGQGVNGKILQPERRSLPLSCPPPQAVAPKSS